QPPASSAAHSSSSKAFSWWIAMMPLSMAHLCVTGAARIRGGVAASGGGDVELARDRGRDERRAPLLGEFDEALRLRDERVDLRRLLVEVRDDAPLLVERGERKPCAQEPLLLNHFSKTGVQRPE